MMETYYVGAYWGARRESAAECARRAERLFQLLARCDPSFHQWYRAGGRGRSAKGEPVPVEDVEALEAVLLGGRVRTDVGKKVVEELGFGLHVWNLANRERTHVSVRCGCTTDAVSNVCVLRPPSQGESAERLLDAAVLARILTSMARAWEPDSGVAHSHAVRERLPEQEEGELTVGWVTYLSRRRGVVPPLPEPVRVEPVGELGTLITLTPERLTASNPEHVALTARVREVLREAGLLRP